MPTYRCVFFFRRSSQCFMVRLRLSSAVIGPYVYAYRAQTKEGDLGIRQLVRRVNILTCFEQ